MNRLEQKHMDFLKKCSSSPNKTHKSDLPLEDLEQMSNEGLLLKYNRVPPVYTITQYGSQLVKETGGAASPEMFKLAVNYVMTKGYNEDLAKQVVENNGVEVILLAQAQEIQKGGQREVSIPVDETGKPIFKPRG